MHLLFIYLTSSDVWILEQKYTIQVEKVRNSETDDQYSKTVILALDLAGLFFL